MIDFLRGATVCCSSFRFACLLLSVACLPRALSLPLLLLLLDFVPNWNYDNFPLTSESQPASSQSIVKVRRAKSALSTTPAYRADETNIQHSLRFPSPRVSPHTIHVNSPWRVFLLQGQRRRRRFRATQLSLTDNGDGSVMQQPQRLERMVA